MAKRGRPTKSPKPGTKASLGLKVTASLKAQLEHEAARNGRTQSQEAEARLERSFDRQGLLPEILSANYGEQIGALIFVIGRIAQTIAISCSGISAAFRERVPISQADIERPLDDPWARDSIRSAIETLLHELMGSVHFTLPEAMRKEMVEKHGLVDLGAQLTLVVLRDLKQGKFPNARWAAEVLHPVLAKAGDEK